MAELKFNDSGTWRTIQEVKINDSGTWRTIQEIYINDAGVWRTVFLNARVNPSWITWNAVSTVASPANAQAAMELNTDGSITVTASTSFTGSTQWYTPSVAGAGNNYWAKVTVTSGSATSNDMSGWAQLNTTRTLTLNQVTIGFNSLTFTLQIATDALGSNVVATWAGNQLSANVTP